jgi:hypothetical protein
MRQPGRRCGRGRLAALRRGLSRVVFGDRQTVVLEFRDRRLRFVWFGQSKVGTRLGKNLYGS